MPISLTVDLRTPNGGFFGTDDGGVPGGALVTLKYDRDVRDADGTVPAPAQGSVVVSGATDPVVSVPFANDDAAVSDDSQGFAIIIGARWRQGTQVVSWSKTVAIDSSYGSAVNLSGLPTAAPVPPQYMTVSGALAAAGQAVSDASAAESSAASSASAAAASAALVGAPAGSAIDAHLGGDATDLVATVAAKAVKPSGNLATGSVYGTDSSGNIAWTTSQTTVARALGWTIATDTQYAGADDGATLRNAIAAAGNGGTIWLGSGKSWTVPDAISTGSAITLLPYQALRGARQMLGAASGSSTSKISFPNISGSAIGITGAASTTVTDVSIFGPDVTAWTTATRGIQFGGSGYSGSAVTLENLSVQGFQTGTYFASQYYVSAHRCEWKNNQVGVTADSCYTISFFAPKFTCSNGDATKFGTAINVTNGGRGPVNIFGGTIENYGPAGGIIMGTNNVTLNLDGTYFESSQSASGNSTGIASLSRTGNVINATGCLVMLAQHRAWIETTGSTGGALNASGNTFVCNSSTIPATPIAYLFSNPSSVDVLLGMGGVDSWTGVTVGSYSSAPGAGRVWRNLPTDAGGTTMQLGRHLQLSAAQVIYLGNGASTSRPTGLLGVPAMWWDITLGKPIFWTGSKWVDATGANV